MSHYDDNAPCPILMCVVDGVCLSDVVDSLGLKHQRQESDDGMYSFLSDQDITGIPELEAHKIPLANVPSWMPVDDPSKAKLKDVRKLAGIEQWTKGE